MVIGCLEFVEKVKRRFYRFSKYSCQERSLILESFVLLGVGRFLVKMIPFKQVAPKLGIINGSEIMYLDDDSKAQSKLIARLVNYTSRFTPFTSNCFNKALAAHFMLRRRGISSTLILGVAKYKEKMEAHAWLTSGDQILTGGYEHERFTEVSHFTWNPK